MALPATVRPGASRASHDAAPTRSQPVKAGLTLHPARSSVRLEKAHEIEFVMSVSRSRCRRGKRHRPLCRHRHDSVQWRVKGASDGKGNLAYTVQMSERSNVGNIEETK